MSSKNKIGKVLKKDFPILKNKIYNNKSLVYLDNAATSQKPKVVIDAVANYYKVSNANVHRGVHYLSEQATAQYEAVREKVKVFLGAKYTEEIIFTRNATSALNMLAHGVCRSLLKKGDTVLITDGEHHSNLVSWQLWGGENGCKLKSVPLLNDGRLDLDAYKKLLRKGIKIVSLAHITNSTGVINDIKTVIELAHQVGAYVCLDACQSIPHIKVSVQKLDCDFLVFTGHKVLGPTGVGVLYGKKQLLDKMVPYEGGGDMIATVSLKETTYNQLPYKFEAGTPNIAGVIGLGAAIDYIHSIGLDIIHEHELKLTEFLLAEFKKDKDIKIIGPDDMANRGGIVSFVIKDLHPHDIATVLDADGVAVRAGHHCAQLVMDRFNVSATTRVSFYLYNTLADVQALLAGIEKAKRILK